LGSDFLTLADQLNATVRQERLLAWLSGLFGVLAIFLSGLGLYGVTSYVATRRRAEIGIRMALGATRTSVIALVLRQHILVVGVGIVLGTLGAATVTRYLESLLFGVTPLDLATFLAAVLVFVAITTLAAYLPAHRATRLDPMTVLRCE
jgi:ABC-type antimicrobial peptide transport system permease subunit